MSERDVVFACGKLTLEGRLHIPERGHRPYAAVVVCHPHPLYGGDMHNNVVMAACDGLVKEGVAAFRFNFRGVGGSQGAHGGGNGEQEDVLAAFAFLEADKEIDRARLGLVGYSFGAGVAVGAAPRKSDLKALALVAAPTASLGTPEMRGFAGPKLVLAGDMDSFMPVEQVRALAGKLAGPVELHVLRGADHFMLGYEGEIAEKVGEFFRRHL